MRRVRSSSATTALSRSTKHQHDLVCDTFETHKAEVATSLEPIEGQHSLANEALEELNARLIELNLQGAANEASIQQKIQSFHELLERRKAELPKMTSSSK